MYEKMIVEGRPLLRENLADTGPPPRKTPIFNIYSFPRSASAVTPSKKVQLTLIGSTVRAFQCTIA